jgi:hypothetical protein
MVNSISNLSIPFVSIPIPFLYLSSFLTYYFLISVGTPSPYLEYLVGVVYIQSRIVIEGIFLNEKIK